METTKKVELTTKENGIVEVLFITCYYDDDGSFLTEKRHRDTLTPLEMERAETILDEYNLNILKAIWTDGVIESYKNKKDEFEFEQIEDIESVEEEVESVVNE